MYLRLLGNLGRKFYLTWRGKRYTFTFLTDAQRAWLEGECMQETWNAIEANPRYTSAERQKRHADFDRAVRDGKFSFEDNGEELVVWMANGRGRIQFVRALLVPDHPELEYNDVRQMIEEKPNEVIGILSLVQHISAAAADNRKAIRQGAKVDINMNDIYKKLVLPPEAGGLGLSIKQVSEMTDAQKIAMYSEEKPVQEERTPEQTASIDNALRQHAAQFEEVFKRGEDRYGKIPEIRNEVTV